MDSLDKMLYEIGEEKIAPSKALINKVKYEVNHQKQLNFNLIMLIIVSILSGVGSVIVLWLIPIPMYIKLLIGVMIWLCTTVVQMLVVMKKDFVIHLLNDMNI